MPGELARVKETKPEKVERPWRCWDGLHGCEQHRPRHDFRFHPLLCLLCVDGVCMRYGVQRSDVELLTLILSMDSGLYRTARYFKASEDKLRALDAGRVTYIPHLLREVKPLGRDTAAVQVKIRAYQDWFMDQAGVSLPKGSGGHVRGFVSAAEVTTV